MEENIKLIFEKDIEIIPKLIFVIPYRDREIHLDIFKKHMCKILEDYDEIEYEILYIHQCDKRNFNRGGMKNIGFIFIKEKYPFDYKNITFVFNDIDIMPKEKNVINYETDINNIKHFYGYNYTLGGIVSIKGSDFEKLNGFPNYWAWGYEDNALQQRAIKKNIYIDRSVFFNMYDPEIIHLNETTVRTVNRGEFKKYLSKTNDGINTITNLKYEYDSNTNFVNVFDFKTPYSPNNTLNKEYDLKKGLSPFNKRFNSRMKMFIN